MSRAERRSHQIISVAASWFADQQNGGSGILFLHHVDIVIRQTSCERFLISRLVQGLGNRLQKTQLPRNEAASRTVQGTQIHFATFLSPIVNASAIVEAYLLIRLAVCVSNTCIREHRFQNFGGPLKGSHHPAWAGTEPVPLERSCGPHRGPEYDRRGANSQPNACSSRSEVDQCRLGFCQDGYASSGKE
jgi:hypothetical protein